MKKITAVLLSVVLLGLCLTGCIMGENADADPSEAISVSEAETNSQSEGNSPIIENVAADLPDEETANEDYLDNEWEFDAPEKHGMDGELLSALHTALAGTQITSVVTVKDGYIVDEYYRDGYDETSVFRLNSCSKSFTGALIGIAIDEGLIDSVDVQISKYFPQLVGTAKEEITIRQILGHTSGIQWYEWGGNGTSFFEMNSADNWVNYVLERPMAAMPGSTFNYTTGGPHLLAAILEQVAEGTMFEYAQNHIFTPLGMDSVLWRVDPQGILDGGNGVEMAAHDAAKFGQLYLNGGSWDGRQLVPESWVEQSTQQQSSGSGSSGVYGYQWWVRTFGSGNYDTYYAMGAMGQYILVVPELDLVTVITSSGSGNTYAPWPYFTDYILAACD